jgi:hypothetical protein
MISYEKVKDNTALLLAVTSLVPLEFETLLIYFQQAWDEYICTNYIDRAKRTRKYGAGRKPRILLKTEDKLLFILYYFKTYPLQSVIAFNFGMSQSHANEWIYKLSTVLRMTLDKLGQIPERDARHLIAALENIAYDEELAIDGTERRCQRPKASEKQKEYYSGKKKAHTLKNNVIVTVQERKVKYQSETYPGKKHDKKICDEEKPTYPEGVILNKDTGFQGYEPEGVVTQQPTKKPRGGELTRAQKNQNFIFSSVRIVVEHVICGIKRCRILKDVFRNTKAKFDDLVMEIGCALHNFRTEIRSYFQINFR